MGKHDVSEEDHGALERREGSLRNKKRLMLQAAGLRLCGRPGAGRLCEQHIIWGRAVTLDFYSNVF